MATNREIEIKNNIITKLTRNFGITPDQALDDQMYHATLLTIRDILMQKNAEFEKEVQEKSAKRVYYMCMEFLIGPSLKNNLMNLGLYSEYSRVLKDFGFSLEKFVKYEDDPALGNGGLGRLASCFMDGLSSLDYPAYGYSICYDYGLFKQKIVDGEQYELPDVWLPTGETWLVPRADLKYTVKFGGYVREYWHNGKMLVDYVDCDEVQAVPYDMMISGADSKAVNILRLWRAQDESKFNMKLFSQGQYIKALEENTNAEVISKVLYPSDNHYEGKQLRLTQQYFLVSASLQCILNEHLSQYGTLDNLADKVAIHINDTHPALCVPELMRILLDECAYDWDTAWDIVTKTMSYTNHTVLPEALETWGEGIFKLKLPRIYTIICEINRRFCESVRNFCGNEDTVARMSIIGYNQVRMANLSIVGSHHVNGVSGLHSDILKKTIFSDFYAMTPEKFTNVTNGIAHRRWLCYSNPGLANLLDSTIGPEYRHSPWELEKFAQYKDDAGVQAKLEQIKKENKERFSKFLLSNQKTLALDCDSIFDVQIKRMHEYKRQLLNVLRIINIYNKLLENPDLEMRPVTFIFGAKAAPGYYRAKQTIKLITHIAAEIEKNPKIRQKLRVVFLENYCVSAAEILIPSADISEQISLAGKEASGTGNMKLMINGALTIGTLDGANVEMHESVGDDNFFLFGLTADEVEKVWREGYRSNVYYTQSETLKEIINSLNRGFNGVSFSDFSNYLLFDGGIPDPYMCFADFNSYNAVHNNMDKIYEDRAKWLSMSAVNIAGAGRFAADRAVKEYADNIWHAEQIKD